MQKNLLSKVNKKYHRILKCRLCGSDLKKIYNFQNTCIGNNLKKTVKGSINQDNFPLVLKNCKECNHFQLNTSVSPKILYASNYTYLSGIGNTFIKHFKSYSLWIFKKTNLKKNDLVVDIGSNDGTCLSFFKKKNLRVCGIDPASVPSDIANRRKIFTINKFYNNNVNKFIINKFGQPSFITSHNVLAHIEDIKSVFLNIYKLLKNKGYFCFEIGYFKEVLNNNYLDTIYHEHLDYHHANPLVSFLNIIGFSVLEIDVNKIQGGTLRLLCKKDEKIRNKKQVLDFLKREKKTILFDKVKIKRNLIKFNENILDVKRKILQVKSNNKKIIGYGAPTKATLLSKLLNLSSKYIDYTLDDNQLKVNKYIPGTDIYIKELKNVDINSIQYIFLYAWNFEKDIVKKIKSMKRKRSKIYILVPLPVLKIYGI